MKLRKAENKREFVPLASKFRPKNLKSFVGQKQLVSKDSPIRSFIETKELPSMIFWGPPGTGKTTLARIIAKKLNRKFYQMSAVNSGKNDLTQIIEKTKNTLFTENPILFLDEIHRWNKAQQDALLPYVEDGKITLIGATTENPSFSLRPALLSRTKVFVFERLSQEDIITALMRVIKKLDLIKQNIVTKKIVRLIADMANGDLRSALNIVDMALKVSSGKKITKKILKNTVQQQVYYDRGDEKYNIISAIHKSLRSSNGDAASYYIMRMLSSGEDPLYVARRLLRFASEDIGNENPNALLLALTTYQTVERLGMPECDTALIQLALYLADCPKNNRAYSVAKQAREDVKKHGNLPVPKHFRNAPTRLMKDLDYGKGYEYDHDLDSKKSTQQCFPDALKGKKYD